MTPVLPFLVLAVLTGSTSRALADKPSTQVGVCSLALSLDRIVSTQTGYAPMTACPAIGFDTLPESAGQRSQAGAYLPETGEILLAPDLDMASALGRSFLLHELVHAAQYRSGIETTVACPAMLEAEAYALQADYLRESGLAREAVMMRVLADHLGSCSQAAEY